MNLSSRMAAVVTLALMSFASASAQEPADKPAADAKLPLSGLAPSKVLPNLCELKYRVSTNSPECQAFFDQGLGFFYSYVWMEAVRSFETAARHDPECAMAWWGLSRAFDSWNKNTLAMKALQKAQELLAGASHREQLLITARLQDKGLIGKLTGDARKKAAIKTLDELLTLYEDDEEGWFARAKLADNTVGTVPFYKALLKYNPLHPGANHELVHFYENFRRPALGWPYAENYIRSSPGIPHPFHMQAHLATRLGRWDKTSDRSARAIELERAYHQEMNVKPSEDFQFSHHLEILTLSLIHDGRFHEARGIKAEAAASKIHHWQPWFRLHLAERNWDDAQAIIAHFRKTDKPLASYFAALLYLKKGDLGCAAAEVEVLQHAYQTSKTTVIENYLWETQGLLMCQTGGVDGGLKLLERLVNRTKDSFQHHAWGNGAYYMEAWGIGALRGGNVEAAEEAFLEALAHDPGSVRAALGLQVLCERQGRTEEAERYAELARRCWKKADPNCLAMEMATMRGEDVSAKTSSDDKGTAP